MARAKRHYIPGHIWHTPVEWSSNSTGQVTHRWQRGWAEEYLGGGKKEREEQWTRSIAVGSRPFVEKVEALLGFRAKGRKIATVGGRAKLTYWNNEERTENTRQIGAYTGLFGHEMGILGRSSGKSEASLYTRTSMAHYP